MKKRARAPRWLPWSDRAICSRVCGGQCCKGSIVPVTLEEADRLVTLAAGLGVEQPGIVPAASVGSEEGPLLMLARPCTFLNKDNLCRIYADRPAHCRDFPGSLRESCPLSVKRFGSL